MKKQEITTCAFIYNTKRQLFIPKRAKNKQFFPDKFELIGGHVEFGESLQEALMREVQEELGLAVTIENPYYAFTYVLADGETHAVEVNYFARFVDPDPQIILHSEDHSDFAWISENQVNHYFDPDDNEKIAVLEGFHYLKMK